ncbi:MAG: hypothetical protein WC141_05115 [Arcobacteraceae bacterium]
MNFTKIKDEIIKSDFGKEIGSLVLRHKFLVSLFVLFLFYAINSEAWSFVDRLINVGTLFAVIVNISINAKNKELELQKIPIYFNKKKLNFEILRKDFTRQELQGVLGVLRVDMKSHYKVEYLSGTDYLEDIYKIQKSKLDKFVVNITKKELEQFKDDIYETINSN